MREFFQRQPEPYEKVEKALAFHLRKRLPAIAEMVRACGFYEANGILIENRGQAPGWDLGDPKDCNDFFQALNRQTLHMAGFRNCLPPDEQVRQI
jgi:hypothetical protein